MRYLAAIIELFGMALIACGLYLLAPWVGLTAAGVCVFIIGLALGVTK